MKYVAGLQNEPKVPVYGFKSTGNQMEQITNLIKAQKKSIFTKYWSQSEARY